MRFLWLLIFLSTSALAQTGTGLTGKYYDAADFTSLVTTRTDASINFNFGSAIPSGTAITAATTYSVAWSGQIEPQFSELYTFFVTADDGARLWVNDELIVQRTFFQGTGEMRGQSRMKAGHRVNVRLEFMQQTGNAAVKLEWASASQAKQVVPTNRLYPTTEIPNGGSLMREVWTGLAGASISTMTSNANYPNKPASREFITSFECIAQNWEDNFGTRVTGFIRAPVSGSYTFAVSGDEVAELYLSTDATSANKALIANTTAATAFRDFAANASQVSAARTLVAGQRYYVELLHKESTGADHWSVGWKQPGDAAFSVIPGSALMQPGVDLATPSTSNYFNTLATEQPRLGATRERFIWLRQQYESPVASQAKSRAQSIVSMADNDVANNVRHYGNEIPRMALAWWLTGDSKYAEKVWSNIDGSMASGTTWTDVKWKGDSLRSIAFAYDWLYPYWDATRRATMLNFFITKGLNSQANAYSNNIGILNDSGFIMTALAVGLGNESKAESNLNQAVSQLLQKINQWEPNAGAWLEGTDYGILAKNGLSPAMMSMETALGSTFSVGRVPGFFTERREPWTIASNSLQRFTFSDIGTGSNNPMGWGNWWGRRYNAPEIYDFSRRAGSSTWNALLLPETTISPVEAEMNPDTAFVGPTDSYRQLFQNVVTLRENWTDSKATFVGGMGGTFMSHGMLQSGTFQLFARGVNWFVDLKSGSYDVPGYNTTTPNPNGPDRWDYYRNRAEGHNCLIVNPTSMPDRIWNAPSAPLIAYQSARNGQRSFAIWDLSGNITGVTKVQRGIQLFNQRKQLLVQDEIVNPTPGACWWFAHFPGDFTTTIGADGSTVILQSGSERLWGKIVRGGGVWTIRTAEPLPASPNPPENLPYSSRLKLSIQLTGVTNTTLAVWFVPLAPGEVAPTTLPTITALNTWNLTAQNEAPIAHNSGANSAGDAPVDVELRTLTTDDWTPTTQLTFGVGGAVGGTVALLADGHTARFTLTGGFTGAQSFTFTATDTDGATSTAATITIGAAAVITNWTSTASGNWSTAANWQGNVVPVHGRGAEIQFFNGQTLAATTVSATNNLTSPTLLNRLVLAGTGTATTVVNLDGSALNLVRNGGTAPTMQLSGATAGYRYNISNAITLDDDVTINASGTGTFLFNGSIDGSGGITRTSSTSTLILAGNNSYTGLTTISAGTLQIGNDGATGTLGTGDVMNNGGLRFDRTGTVDVPNDISGSGSLTVNGVASTDVVNLTGNNSFTGAVTMSSGSLRITDAVQLGAGTKNVIVSGTASALRLDGSAGAIELPVEFSFVTSNPNGAIFNEAGDNIIEGSVTLTSGAGNTRITSNSGTLTIQGNVQPNVTGRALDLRGAGKGRINGSILDGAVPNTLSGVSKNDAGTWTLNGSNAFTGATTVSAGKLIINGPHSSGAVTVAAGATLAGNGSLTAATTITGTLAPGDNVGTMNFGSTLSFGAASKALWELGSNSLAGDQAIAAGAISVTAGAKIDVALNSAGSTVNFLHSFWRTIRTFPVVTGASLGGTFALGTVSADAGGRPVSTYGSFALQHTATGANLVWTPIPGFPVIDDPVVTLTRPTTLPISIADEQHSLRVSVTASNGTISGYAWTLVSGPDAATFANASAADTTATFADQGTYVLRCTATNQVGSTSRDLTVEVAPTPQQLVLTDGVAGTAVPSTFIRADSTAWNSGARDQLLVGRNGGGIFRTLLSFPIPLALQGSFIAEASLDLTLAASGAGTGTGTLDLHRLLTAFTEGTGDGITSTNGSGTGADWLRRTYTPATTNWTGSGASGDYVATPLSTLPSLDPTGTPGGTVFSFATTSAFTSAVADAINSAQPLNLLVKATIDSLSTSSYVRFASDDHATPDYRPTLNIAYHDHLAPIIAPGTAPAAGVGSAAHIAGTVTNGTGAGWTYESGPGPVFLTNATALGATVLFTKPGTHVLRLTATNTRGETSRTLLVTVTGTALTELEIWRQTHFGTFANSGSSGDLFDANNDGEVNLMEFATAQNPNAATTATPSMVKNGAVLEFTYTRSRAALADGVTFTVEWSDTLTAGSWSTTGVSPPVILSDNGVTQQVKVPVPAGSGVARWFVHLKVTKP